MRQKFNTDTDGQTDRNTRIKQYERQDACLAKEL